MIKDAAQPLSVIVLDPGLREFGGHHPGIIEGLAHSDAINEAAVELTVYAHKDCSEQLLAKMTQGNIKVTPYFESDFYKHFYSKEKLSFFNAYITELAKEYLGAMQQYGNKPAVFLYHTLNWEHAIALSLAISLYQKTAGISQQHLVCLMFNPHATESDNLIAAIRYGKFHLGFNALSKCPSVTLFAAEHELTQSYQAMLGQALDWHPCGLLSSQHMQDIEQGQRNHKEKKNILLFVGDAKENKGFLQLPQLVEKISKTIIDPDARIVLQYTITNDSASLAQVDDLLQQLQAKDARIVLLRHFLSDNEMHQLWLNTASVVLNYEATAYQKQSSGVLWLAAAYQTRMYFMTKTWLNREANRLGCDYHESNTLEELMQQLSSSSLVVEKATEKNNSVNEFTGRNGQYAQRLFSDLGEWLVSNIRALKGQ